MHRFELETLTDYSKEEILAELRRVAALHSEGPLTQIIFKALSPKVSASTIVKRFGGWKQGLEAAGLSHRYVTANMPWFAKMQRGAMMSDDELIAEIQRVHALLGGDVLTARDFSEQSVTHYEVVLKRFASWKMALERAGIGQANLGRRYTDQLCYENIVALWTHYGRQPQYRELKEPPSTVGPKAYKVRWGSWRKALKAFVGWANSESEDEPFQVPDPLEEMQSGVVDPPRTPQRKEEDCREIRPGLRFRVFMRDRFRCVACGRSPATHLNVELHADHIVSVHDGGKSTFENLQSLCAECNLGKGRISIR